MFLAVLLLLGAILMMAPAPAVAQAGEGNGHMMKDGATAQAPMEHPQAPSPFYREHTFLILLGVGIGGGGFFAYRAGRVRWRRKKYPADFATEAVLVVDLVDSTRLATHYGRGAAMRASEILHDHALGFAELNGLTFSKSTGDGFLMTFPTVSDACATAISLLRKLNEKTTEPPPAARLDLRAGISYGETVKNGGNDRFGAVINKAFRLEGLSREGFVQVEGESNTLPTIADHNRIFVDEEAAQELHRERDGTIPPRYLGFAKLKGFSGLHRVYEAPWSATEQAVGSVAHDDMSGRPETKQ